EKVLFLEQAGFSQVVLARELSIREIREIRARTHVKLECFIHGALCVGVSGRCYLSAAVTGRSANRGECAQLCRVAQSLYDSDGNCLARDRYLLSMKDLSQAPNIGELIDAGISSFKIEGRLKDEGYVRNVTAYYRALIDRVLEGFPDVRRSSFGTTRTAFKPDISKSFNRGFTEYNAHEVKENYANFDAPGFVGTRIGTLMEQGAHDLRFKLDKGVVLGNGDSLNYYTAEGALEGFRASSAKDGGVAEVFQRLPPIKPGTVFYRSKDANFERSLEGESSVRTLALRLRYSETPKGARLEAADETGASAVAEEEIPKLQQASDFARLEKNLREKLGRLGQSHYELSELTLDLPYHHFMPQSLINALRRSAIAMLDEQKQSRRVHVEHHFKDAPMLPESERHLGFRANLFNRQASEFYKEHGGEDAAPAYEAQRPEGPQPVLVSKHCLRFCFGMCRKHGQDGKVRPLKLKIGKTFFDLKFDCRNCLMILEGPVKE
ncbi:MAG: U32 family peptidase, partial [Succinivibrio sp.]